MAILGYNTIGSELVGSIEGRIRGSRFTMTEDGTADSIVAYIANTTSTKTMKAAIYLSSDSSLVAQSNENSVVAGTTWNTFTFSGTVNLTNGVTYIFVVWSASGTGNANLYWDAGTTNQGANDAETYGTWPNPLVSTDNDQKHSIYLNYTPDSGSATLSESKRITYRISSSNTKNTRVTYYIGTIINKSVRVTYNIVRNPHKCLVIPYNQYRDHNLSVKTTTNSGSTWTDANAISPIPIFFLTSTNYPNWGITNYQHRFTANYRVGDNECIRQKFYVDTAFYSERLFLQAGYSTNRPSDHLRFRIYDKAGSQILGGQFRHSSLVPLSATSEIPSYNRYWMSTLLPYSFSTGLHTLTLYASTNGVKQRYYNVWVTQSYDRSFQGATALYSYSSDSGKSWNNAAAGHDIPFMLGVRALVGTVLSPVNIGYGGAKVYLKSSSYPTYNKFTITDHSGYYELPLKREYVQSVHVEKYDFEFKHNNESFDGYDTSLFNMNKILSTAGFNNRFTIIPNTYTYQATSGSLWWSETINGISTSQGMNYAFRDKILFSPTHTAYATSQVIKLVAKTGEMLKFPIDDAHPVYGISTWAGALVYHSQKSHVFYMSRDFNIKMASYDHINNIFYHTSKFVTASGTINDTHFAPSATVDQRGYVHLFYGCHISPLAYMRSGANGNVDVWTNSYYIDSSLTYPRPYVTSTGEVIVFVRKHYTDGNTGWAFIRKDNSTGAPSSWHTSRTIFHYKTSHSALAGQELKSIYSLGNGIDNNDNFHCVLLPTMGYLGDYEEQGVVYCYSTSLGYRWRDMKKNVPWEAKAGVVTDFGNVPWILSYNTVSPVFLSSVSTNWETGTYQGNFDAFAFGNHDATANTTLKRPFFMAGYRSTNAPTTEGVQYLLIKWMGHNQTWGRVSVSTAFGKRVFLGHYGGGLVFGEGDELYTTYGYQNASAVAWGGSCGLVECKSIDYGSSWSFNIITDKAGVGQPISVPKKNFSGRYMENAISIGNDIYYTKNSRRYPYMRPDGEDVRLVYRGTEIDRIADVWNYASTNIEFRIQVPLLANYSSATSGYYYLYYGRDRWQ